MKVDGCRISSVLGSFIGRMFFKNLIDTADFEFKCPYLKGPHHVTNFTLALPEKVPLPDNVKMCLVFRTVAKVAGSKRFVRLFVMKSHLSYIH
jgi:Protein of unknown function (DUF1091)